MYFCIRLFRAFRPGPCILHSPAGAGSDAAADPLHRFCFRPAYNFFAFCDKMRLIFQKVSKDGFFSHIFPDCTRSPPFTTLPS